MSILQPEENPKFGLGFKVLVIFMATLCCIAFTLNAMQQGEFRAWVPAFFSYAILGAVLLPRKAAMICGYFISSTICLFCAWIIFRGLVFGEDLNNALRFSMFYGTPALGFLVYGKVRSYRWNLTIKSIKDSA